MIYSENSLCLMKLKEICDSDKIYYNVDKYWDKMLLQHYKKAITYQSNRIIMYNIVTGANSKYAQEPQ